MTGVIDDRQFGNTATQLDRNLPHRHVTIYLLVIAGETAVDSCQALHTSLVQTLHRTNPQLQVGVDGILHEDGDIHTLQRVGKCLHGKRIGRGTRTHPQDINAILQAELHMLRCSHLGSHQHLRLLLHLLQPNEGWFTMSLEATGFRTGLPYPGTEVMTSVHCQLLGGSHHLLLTLSTAGSCNDEGAFIVTWKIQFF